MTLLRPSALWLLLGVLALAVGYVLAERRRSRYAVRFTELDLLDVVAPDSPRWRHVPAALFLLSLAVAAVGFARPAYTTTTTRTTGTIVLAVDVSPSMQATDVAPNRLTAAQNAATAFVDLLPADVDVALVTFAGSAETMVPPTTDRALVKGALARLDYRSETAIGEAIFAALAATDLRMASRLDVAVPAQVLLLSDGATTQGRPESTAVLAAQRADIPISTIAFGTSGGTVELGGSVQKVAPDVGALEVVAAETGGEFFAAATEAELLAAYDEVRTGELPVPVERDLGWWFIATALALAVLAGLGSLIWFERLP